MQCIADSAVQFATMHDIAVLYIRMPYRAGRAGVVEECVRIASLLSGVSIWVRAQVTITLMELQESSLSILSIPSPAAGRAATVSTAGGRTHQVRGGQGEGWGGKAAHRLGCDNI